MAFVDALRARYSDINFVEHSTFAWSPREHTVYYIKSPGSRDGRMSLLHEVAHALLGHQRYAYDIELVRLEVFAWQKTTALASEFGLTLSEAAVEQCLESYRDWLHARSLCPQCEQTGLQQHDQIYRCIACGNRWRVPIKQACAIKRWQKL